MKMWFLTLLFLIGCNSQAPKLSPINNVAGPAVPSAGVKVVVTGMGAGSLVATLNGESNLTIAADGEYTFPNLVMANLEFEVKVESNPVDRNCFVTNPLGVATNPEQLIKIKCMPLNEFFVGGLISGNFTGNITLGLNVGGTTKTFEITEGATSFYYDAEILGIPTSLFIITRPITNQCFFGNGTESATMSAPYNRLNLFCVPSTVNTYSIGLAITGLAGSIKVGSQSAGIQTFSSSGLQNFIASAKENEVGSSRVDLQACKLEYSIVSPK